MTETDFIFADGTFKCVLDGYSQLYVFHAMVENNVSLPMLFCLVKGKKATVYKKLLELVEGLAKKSDSTIFNLPVTLMCDFEAAFITVVQTHYKSGPS